MFLKIEVINNSYINIKRIGCAACESHFSICKIEQFEGRMKLDNSYS